MVKIFSSVGATDALSTLNGSYADFWTLVNNTSLSIYPDFTHGGACFYANAIGGDGNWYFKMYTMTSSWFSVVSINGGNTDPTPNTFLTDFPNTAAYNVANVQYYYPMKLNSLNTVFSSPLILTTDDYQDFKSIIYGRGYYQANCASILAYTNIKFNDDQWNFNLFTIPDGSSTPNYSLSLQAGSNTNPLPVTFANDFPHATQFQSYESNFIWT